MMFCDTCNAIDPPHAPGCASAPAHANRLARYSDAEIEATLAEIATIEKFSMTAMERGIADDIRAEHARREVARTKEQSDV